MHLNLEEQKLLADFRLLSPDKQQEALDYVAFLRKKGTDSRAADADTPSDRCQIGGSEKSTSESQEEPLITE